MSTTMINTEDNDNWAKGVKFMKSELVLYFSQIVAHEWMVENN